MATAKTAAGTKRDVSRALDLFTALGEKYPAMAMETESTELIELLRAIDARTGRRDPTKRRKPPVVAVKRAGKKAAKRGR